MLIVLTVHVPLALDSLLMLLLFLLLQGTLSHMSPEVRASSVLHVALHSFAF
jgi:hypothetical protein